MVGKRFWWIYLSESGSRYAVELDEDVGERFGFDPLLFNTEELPTLPSGFRMRVVNLRNRATGQPRAVPVGKATHDAYNGTLREIGFNGAFWDITGTRGERIRRPRGRNL